MRSRIRPSFLAAAAWAVVEALAWLEGERNDGDYIELVRRPAGLRWRLEEPSPQV